MSESASSNSPARVLKSFPRMLFYPAHHLLAWHPAGILDGATLNRMIDFVEAEEASSQAPFDRYVDLDEVSELRFDFADTLDVTDRRRERYTGPLVRTAIFSSRPLGYGMGRMYATLLQGSQINARAFRDLAEAADWLGVPLAALCPPDDSFAAQSPPGSVT